MSHAHLSVVSGVEAALDSQHFKASVFRFNVAMRKLLEARIHMQRNPDLTSFLVDDLEDFQDDGLLDFLNLYYQQWVVIKQLLRFLVEVRLLEFLIVLEHLRVLMDLELASQIKKDALQDIEGVAVEIVDHNGVMMRAALDVLAHHLVTIQNRR